MSSDIGNNLNSSLNNNDHFNCYSSFSDSAAKITTNKNTTPIKFVDKSLYKMQMKVVKDVGTCSTVAAVPQLIKNGEQTAKRV